jgi:transketolase
MLPNAEVIQPGSRKELDVLLRSQYNNGKTTYFRLSDHPHSIDVSVEFGKGCVLKRGASRVTVMTAGPILGNVMQACESLDVTVVYFHTIKPIDRELIAQFRNTKILVVHDAYGLYEAIQEVPYISASYHGLPDEFCSWYGKLPDIRKKIGLDPDSIAQTVKKTIFAA